MVRPSALALSKPKLERDWFTLSQVSARLNVSKDRVRRAAKTVGALKVMRNREAHYHSSDVWKMMQAILSG